jgi:hypothetical protein
VGSPAEGAPADATDGADLADTAEMSGSAGVAEGEAAPARPPSGAEDALEKLLAEEEEIERRTREQHHDLPHFRNETD